MPHALSKTEVGANRILKKFGLPAYADPQPAKVHIKASDAISLIGEEKFNAYFSFAFVRNPWDWQVSLYKYMLKSPEHHQHEFIKKMSGFDEYVRWRCLEEVRLQHDFIYSGSGELLIDFVGRFENIDNDFRKICSHIGIDEDLPKLNVSNTLPYQEYYNSETRDLITQYFKKDIDMFSYSF